MDRPRPVSGASRRRLRVTGTVQGVGFRPFVYRHAVSLGLVGFVLNDSTGVLVEVEGDPASIGELCRIMTEEAPPLARVESVDVSRLAPDPGEWSDFSIVQSDEGGIPAAAVSVDSATCDECLAEVSDPSDRRYRYPFTNCTNCGPRYTIVRSVPYDRRSTTMAGFAMCPQCASEYEDPSSRRFHAQPNTCPTCGPVLKWCAPTGEVLAEADDALTLATRALAQGSIVAVKGLGGYHLAVDATDESAVALLRERKNRDDKPFAVMVTSIEEARTLCDLDSAAEQALSSVRRPVVLASRRPGGPIAPGVARGLAELGLMLPYTPLHRLLLAGVGRPLVMTSGNLSDDPIAYEEVDATARLGPMVDALLAHDRPIHVRCDDSVARAVGGTVQLIRRSRGFAPEPIPLSAPALRQVLAVGAELKNTVTVAKGEHLVTSHHIGDLEHLATYESFLQATRHMCDLYGIEPEVVAHDLHPEYLSTKWALDRDLDLRPVQHHHAHVVSCMVEHGRTDPVLGLAFDGLGFGGDGTLWGGEALVADISGYERVGHLLPVTMPGGAGAIREPWRMALAWIAEAAGMDEATRQGELLDPRWQAVLGLVETSAAPSTTSVGRLFDAVAAIIGVRKTVNYEGQAAIELEALARGTQEKPSPVYGCELVPAEGPWVLDLRPTITGVLADVERGTDRAVIAARFHATVGAGAALLAGTLASRHGLDTVALSGGVFQNALLSRIVAGDLEAQGIEVLVHRLVPPNDGGISVGQAAVAALSEL